MKSIGQEYGSVIISLLTAIAIIIAALVWKDTQYENSWLYILCIGMVANSLFEVSMNRKKK